MLNMNTEFRLLKSEAEKDGVINEKKCFERDD